MSALTPKADIELAKCQKLPYAPQQKASLFDHLVGAQQE